MSFDVYDPDILSGFLRVKLTILSFELDSFQNAHAVLTNYDAI